MQVTYWRSVSHHPLALHMRPSQKNWTAWCAWALTLPKWKAPAVVWHFALSHQPLQNNSRGTRFCTATRICTFIQRKNCICLWELPHCPFRVRLHGLLFGQEARIVEAAPTFLRCSESLLPWGILADSQAVTDTALFVQVLPAHTTRAEQWQARQPLHCRVSHTKQTNPKNTTPKKPKTTTTKNQIPNHWKKLFA